MNEFDRLFHEVERWQNKTFGIGGKGVGACNHLLEEVKTELLPLLEKDDTSKSFDLYEEICEELADAFLLLIAIASKREIDSLYFMDHVWDKLDINRDREWSEPDENGVCRHIEE